MIKPRILVLALLLAVAGGLAAPPAAASGGSDAEGAPLDRYMTLEPLIVGVIRDGRVVHQVSITIVLHVESREAEERVTALLPRLEAAFQRDMHTMVSAPYPGRAFVFDAARAKAQLNRRAQQIVGPGVVRELLLTRIFDLPV